MGSCQTGDVRRGSRLAGFVVASALAIALAAEEERPQWTVIAPGLWYRSWPVPIEFGEGPLAGHVFRVDPRIARVQVLDARRDDRRTARVATLREESSSVLVINGGFFDAQNKPLGLVISQSGETSPLRRLDQGIFLIAGGVPKIQHASDPIPPNVEAALQTWPRLVVGGRALRLKPQKSRRSAICVPGDGTVLLLVFERPISLQDLATALAVAPQDGGLGCWTAVNLDGGPSTQLSLKTPAMSLEIEGGWPVPNAVAVTPR
jgi:uncharacterized protein YigE (DUF2233 family)